MVPIHSYFLRALQVQCNSIFITIASKDLKTLVLDLDETLVHSSVEEPNIVSYQFTIDLENQNQQIFVAQRPGVKEFLRILSQYYEIVIYTAGQQTYAEKVIEYLDPEHFISHCLYRQHCFPLNKGYVKDLSKLGRDLKDIIIIDNSYECFQLQPENGYLIASFFCDQNDDELFQIIEFLIQMSELEDVRDVEIWKEKFDEIVMEEQLKEIQREKAGNFEITSIQDIQEINESTSQLDNQQSSNTCKQNSNGNSKQTSGKLMQFIDDEIREEKCSPLILSNLEGEFEQNNQQESEFQEQLFSPQLPQKQKILKKVQNKISQTVQVKTRSIKAKMAIKEGQYEINKDFLKQEFTQNSLKEFQNYLEFSKQIKTVCNIRELQQAKFEKETREELNIKINQQRFSPSNNNLMSPLSKDQQYFTKSCKIFLY